MTGRGGDRTQQRQVVNNNANVQQEVQKPKNIKHLRRTETACDTNSFFSVRFFLAFLFI